MKKSDFNKGMSEIMKADPSLTKGQAFVKMKIKAKLIDRVKGGR